MGYPQRLSFIGSSFRKEVDVIGSQHRCLSFYVHQVWDKLMVWGYNFSKVPTVQRVNHSGFLKGSEMLDLCIQFYFKEIEDGKLKSFYKDSFGFVLQCDNNKYYTIFVLKKFWEAECRFVGVVVEIK
jgi:hypothetical protein